MASALVLVTRTLANAPGKCALQLTGAKLSTMKENSSWGETKVLEHGLRQSWAALEHWDLICWSPEHRGDAHPSFALAATLTFRRVSHRKHKVVVLNHQVAQDKEQEPHDPGAKAAYVWKQRGRASTIFLWKCWVKSLLLLSGLGNPSISGYIKKSTRLYRGLAWTWDWQLFQSIC